MNAKFNKKERITPMNFTVQGPQTSFKAIYIQEDTFNPQQAPVASAIRAKLEEPSPIFNNKSADKFYEQEHNIAFEIKPSGDDFKSVKVIAYKGADKIANGIVNGITYDDCTLIGEYNKDSQFDLSDIDTEIKKKKRIDTGWKVLLTASAVAAVIAVASMMLKGVSPANKGKVEPLIEQADSTAKKAAMHLKW